MKILLFVFVFILIRPTDAQWYVQNSNSTADLAFVQFVNANVGWTISEYPIEILKTTDGGTNWLFQHQSDGPLLSAFFLNENVGWFTDLDSQGGRLIYTSDGGNSWTTRFPASYYFFHDLHFFDTNIGISGGSYGAPQTGEIMRTTDGGASWNFVFNNGAVFYCTYFLDTLNGWCGGISALVKTTNGGQNWSELPSFPGSSIWKIEFFNTAEGWVGSDNQIFFTSDGGSTWNSKVNYAMDFWFAGPDTGWYIYHDNIYYTSNRGATWDLQYSNPADTLNRISFINSNEGWVVGNHGVILQTINGGLPVELLSFMGNVFEGEIHLTWTAATETNNRGFAVERKVGSKQYAVSKWNKIGFVEGNGTTTQPHNYSFTDKDNLSGSIKYRLKQIDFDGSYKYSNVVEVSITNPTKFSLEQNYPNPFNPSTVIGYQLQVNGQVTLKVYDLLGREAATLVNEYKPAGKYEVEFDGSKLNSGIYFYSLQEGNFKQVKKMIVMK